MKNPLKYLGLAILSLALYVTAIDAFAQVNCSGGLAANCAGADIAQANGGAGGAGGNAMLTDNSRTTNTNTNVNTNTNTNVNTAAAAAAAAQQQGQLQGQLQGQGQIQGQQANNNGNNWSYTNVQPDSLRTVGIAPSILANPTAPCRIQGGAGGGWLGGAFSVSGSILDEGCDARADVMALLGMNQPQAAINRACQKPEMAKALGPLCPAPVTPVKTTAPVKSGTGTISSGKF